VAVIDTGATMNELYDVYARGGFDRISTLIDENIDWLIYAPVMAFPLCRAAAGLCSRGAGLIQRVSATWQAPVTPADHI